VGKARKALRVILYSLASIIGAFVILFAAILIMSNLSAAPGHENDEFYELRATDLEESEVHSGSDFDESQMSESSSTDYDISDLPVDEATYGGYTEEYLPSPESEYNEYYEYYEYPNDYMQGLLPLEAGYLSESLQAAIDDIATRHRAIGVQVAVIRNGTVYGAHSFGYASRDIQAMTDEHKIRVASLTKPILAMTIMALEDEGILSIDEDIGEYWGMTVRNPNRSDYPITLQQMLSHTSSINDFPLGFHSNDALLREQFRDGTIFRNTTPGRIGSWLYSNFAYTTLGVTVEVAVGETVNSLASEFLFQPLEIDAAFGSGSVERTDLLATLYTAGGGIGRSVSRQIDTPGSTFPGETGVEFSGGLTISATDLAQLLAVLINNGQYRGVNILSPESVARMESSMGSTGSFEQLLSMRKVSGLFGEEVLIYHTGSNFGMFALMSYNPITGNGVVVLTTGARDERNALGMRMVCADISEYIYEYLRLR